MNYRDFIKAIPEVFDSWDQDNIYPKDQQFSKVLGHIKGMTTANVMQLLNLSLKFLSENEIYCEIGCYQGSTLVGALLGNNQVNALAADNFSEFDPTGKNESILLENLQNFELESQVNFFNCDFEDFFRDWLFAINSKETDESLSQLIHSKIGVYFYDGAHDYRSQLMALLLAKPFLADQALIIVDDSNWESVKQANWDFILSHPEASMLMELYTPQDGHYTFWNGIHIIGWDKNTSNISDLEKVDIPRQERLIKGIYSLHMHLIRNSM